MPLAGCHHAHRFQPHLSSRNACRAGSSFVTLQALPGNTASYLYIKSGAMACACTTALLTSVDACCLHCPLAIGTEADLLHPLSPQCHGPCLQDPSATEQTVPGSSLRCCAPVQIALHEGEPSHVSCLTCPLVVTCPWTHWLEVSCRSLTLMRNNRQRLEHHWHSDACHLAAQAIARRQCYGRVLADF